MKIKIKFKDYFNEGNIVGLGYGYVGCFLMWLCGTNDLKAMDNILRAAYERVGRSNGN